MPVAQSPLTADWERWTTDTADFAASCLKVLTKAGKLVPLHLNSVQRKLVRVLDEQLHRTGRVRHVVVKARQMGISTGVAARFLRDANLKPGVRVSVVAHRKDATANLADMTTRFYDHLPPAVQVPLVRRNTTELHFSHESSYVLSTAGTSADPGATGRSRTATRLHASEYAFWKGAGERMAGLGQTLADEPGTEGIVESTTQGQANPLYTLWRESQAGISDWEGTFFPWWEEDSYRRPPPPGFTLSDEGRGEGVLSDRAYAERYELPMDRMYWRALKIAELSISGEQHGLLMWAREYPATAEEAFLTTGEAAFLSAVVVADARARKFLPTHGYEAPLVVGVDPATSHGPDSSVIVRRRRYKAYGIEAYPAMSHEELLARVWHIWQEERPAHIVVDMGEGDHLYTSLLQRGAPVIGVYFGGRPDLRERYADKRAELYGRLAGWLPKADIPEDEELARDLLAQRVMPLEKTQIRLVSKPELKKGGLPSPDRGDALALTMEVVDGDAAGHGEVVVAPGPFDGADAPAYSPFEPPLAQSQSVVAPLDIWS